MVEASVDLMALAEGNAEGTDELSGSKMDKSRLKRFESNLSAKEEGLTPVRSSLSNRGGSGRKVGSATGASPNNGRGEVESTNVSPLKDTVFVRQDTMRTSGQAANGHHITASSSSGGSWTPLLRVVLFYLLVCLIALIAGSREPLPTSAADALTYVPRSLGFMAPPPEEPKKTFYFF